MNEHKNERHSEDGRGWHHSRGGARAHTALAVDVSAKVPIVGVNAGALCGPLSSFIRYAYAVHMLVNIDLVVVGYIL